MKSYIVNICPECKEPTKYVANPFYLHTCHCGHETTQSKLITAVDSEAVSKDISELSELLARFPSVKSLRKKK